MKKFNYKLFVQKFLNNQLKDIEDQEIYDSDINNILNEIDIEPNEIISILSQQLPLITLSFIKYYNNKSIISHRFCYRIYKNIFINFCYKKYTFKILYKMFHIILAIFDRPEDLNEYTTIMNNKKAHKLFLSVRESEEFIIYTYHVYKKLRPRQQVQIAYLELINIIMNLYISYDIQKCKNYKLLINIFTKILITDMNNLRKNHSLALYNTNNKAYFTFINIIINNWNYINIKYKNILRKANIGWIDQIERAKNKEIQKQIQLCQYLKIQNNNEKEKVNLQIHKEIYQYIFVNLQ